ncbi:hypothetical protein BDR26DRAFT_915433, partial [Obelidium mucronatum]
MLPAIQNPGKQHNHVSIVDNREDKGLQQQQQQDVVTANEVADEVAKKQIPYVHAYQFHGYDPSRDPLLIRKQPILRPLVDFKGLEFHRHWPLEYLSQRLQKEREKELSHFRRLFQLRVNNPYIVTSELEYYKMSSPTKTSQLHGTKQHHHHPHMKLRRPSHHHTREEAEKEKEAARHGLPPKHQYHPHPPRHTNVPVELQAPHVLQQKLKTRYQKYRYLVHLPQHASPPTTSDGSVFSRLATQTPRRCRHFVEDAPPPPPPP